MTANEADGETPRQASTESFEHCPGMDHITPCMTPRPCTPAVVTLSTYHSKPSAVDGQCDLKFAERREDGPAAAAPAPTTGTGESNDETELASARYGVIFCHSARPSPRVTSDPYRAQILDGRDELLYPPTRVDWKVEVNVGRLFFKIVP